LPVLHALRFRFPHAKITWVVNQVYAPLLDGHPDLDEVLPFDRKNGWRAFPLLLRELYRRKFDLAIDLQGLLRTGLMTGATRAPRCVGLSCSREGSRFFYTDLLPSPPLRGRGDGGEGVREVALGRRSPPEAGGEEEKARPYSKSAVVSKESLHAVDRYWVVAEALGVGHLEKSFVLPICNSAKEWTLQRLAAFPRPWLAVCPGSRWPTKRWPPWHFADLICCAQAKFGGTAILLGGQDERPVCQTVAQKSAGLALDLSGETTLPQLAALLSLADVVLANDSGPLHLAAALGRPVVAPYTCTQVARHGPFGQFQHAVPSTVWCAGSYRKRCGRLECMQELLPDRLGPVLEEALFTWASRCHSD
jgi:ADP-heptose:LPS heptosyltransferase